MDNYLLTVNLQLAINDTDTTALTAENISSIVGHVSNASKDIIFANMTAKYLEYRTFLKFDCPVGYVQSLQSYSCGMYIRVFKNIENIMA